MGKNIIFKKKKKCSRCPEQTRFHLKEETKLLSSMRLQLLSVGLHSADEGRKIKAHKQMYDDGDVSNPAGCGCVLDGCNYFRGNF